MPRGTKIETELDSDGVHAALVAAARLQAKEDSGLDLTAEAFDGSADVQIPSAVVTFTKKAAAPVPSPSDSAQAFRDAAAKPAAATDEAGHDPASTTHTSVSG